MARNQACQIIFMMTEKFFYNLFFSPNVKEVYCGENGILRYVQNKIQNSSMVFLWLVSMVIYFEHVNVLIFKNTLKYCSFVHLKN